MSMRRFSEGLLMGLSPQVADRAASLYKKDAPPPDYTAMAEATDRSVDMMKEYSDSQLAETKRQFDAVNPTLQRIAQSQLTAMDQQTEQAQDHYNFYKDNYRPIEEGLIDDVNNYNTDAERQRIARQAGADVEQQSSIQNEISNRALASRGINPNSGAALAMGKQNSLQTALARAGAMTNARDRAKDTGYARKMQATNLGRGMPALSLQGYSGANNSGNSAAGTTMTAPNFMMNGMNSAGNTMTGAASANMQGAGNVLNAQSSYASTVGNGMTLGDLAGTALATWAGTGFS